MLFDKEKIKNAFKKVWEIAIWCLLVLLIYIVIDRQYISFGTDNPMKTVYTYSNVSTALNEKSELVITNRSTGSYKIYSDSVAMGIFNMMATQLSNEYEINIKRKAY